MDPQRTIVHRNEYRTSRVPDATVSLSVGGKFEPLLRVCNHARIDVTSHGPENCHPEIVTDTFSPFSKGPQAGASGRAPMDLIIFFHHRESSLCVIGLLLG